MMRAWAVLVLAAAAVRAFDTCTCPDSCSVKEELGRGTWLLLHQIAENTEPTPANEEAFRTFIRSLSQLYPCDVCREHFQRNLVDFDIQLDPMNMCQFHNLVNEQLDKPLHPCDVVV